MIEQLAWPQQAGPSRVFTRKPCSVRKALKLVSTGVFETAVASAIARMDSCSSEPRTRRAKMTTYFSEPRSGASA
jgi:hypothetical protein